MLPLHSSFIYMYVDGVKQASSLGRHLKRIVENHGHSDLSESYSHIFLSPLRRAVDTFKTVEGLMEVGGVIIEEDANLRGWL